MAIKEQVTPKSTGDSMSIERQQDMAHYKRRAQELVRQALSDGVVITISIAPRQPLAMGNYDLAVDVRERRVLADPITRIQGEKA